MKFYLGTHHEHWLATLDVPLFVSHRRLKRRRRLPVARMGWALDSGAFSELQQYGEWRTSEAEYIEAVYRYDAEVGRLDWAAPMDWMCEPFMIDKTGLTLAEHQARTVENYCRLRQAAPDLPFVPVLQGWQLEDYIRCAEQYGAAGVNLASEPTVGIGSVCRRQNSAEIERIIRTIGSCGIDLHGFGVKTLGLARYGRYLKSADSMAWSYDARRSRPLPGCRSHKNCANCHLWALRWRDRVLATLDAALAQLEFAL